MEGLKVNPTFNYLELRTGMRGKVIDISPETSKDPKLRWQGRFLNVTSPENSEISVIPMLNSLVKSGTIWRYDIDNTVITFDDDGAAEDEPFNPSLREVGYGTDISRLDDHKNHSGSNHLMNLAEACCRYDAFDKYSSSSVTTILVVPLNPRLKLLLKTQHILPGPSTSATRSHHTPSNLRLSLVAAESFDTASEREHNVGTAPLEDHLRGVRSSIVANEHQSLSILEPAQYSHA